MKKILEWMLECKDMKALIGKSVLYFVIPYLYLIFCGLFFDKLLKWYFMTTFIFFSLMALYLVAIVLIVIMIVKFIKKRK